MNGNGGRTWLATGVAQPSGPLSVVLHQSTVDRPDPMSACVQKGVARIVCRE